jgi:hypothetical protein
MKILLTIGCLIVFGTVLSAQTYEIRLSQAAANTLLVQMRMAAGTPPTTANRVQDVVFGIKWLQACGSNTDLITPTNFGFNMVTSGVKAAKGLYYYRVFGADPTNFTLPANWTTGTWVTIYSIQSNQQGTGLCDFEICEVGFDASLSNQTGPNFNIDFTDYTPVLNGATRIVLPIELLNFDAKRQDQTVNLTWQTANETQNKGFNIERSADGKTFENIGFVKSAGNSTSLLSYQYTDEYPLSILNYYRLTQVDLDGTETFSKTVSVSFPSKQLLVKAFPNPFSNSITVDMSTDKMGDLMIELTDIRGQQIYQSKRQNTEGVLSVTISTKNLSNGTYFLKVSDGQAVVSQKIVKE